MKKYLLLTSFALAACGTLPDNTIFEANREQRADSIASGACDKYATCNTYGSDQTFQTRVDCVADYKQRALTLWPSDKCGNGQINDGKFSICSDRVDSQACSQNFFDSVSALAECNASAVCSDPRRD